MTLPTDKVPVLPFYHQNQPDRPNTVYPTSLALKQAFDSSTIALQNAINAIIDDLISTVSLASGAEQIGSASITGVSGNTIYDQLVDLKVQIQAIVGGSIPPQSITTGMLQDGVVTFEKLEDSMQAATAFGLLGSYTAWGGI